jgi:energy-coupling factor transporter ATP-binding protein EcfA2
MRFDKEPLFKELVRKHGFNVYLGAGFSVYAINDDGESLPLGNRINDKLIKLFQLDKTRGFNLSKTCQKIKKDSEGLLEKILKDTYRVCDFDNIYLELTKMPIKNIVTTNIDDLVERIYGSKESKIRISDSKIYGTLEKENMVNLFKLHGSVTYPLGEKMSFTEKELTDLFIRDKGLFESVTYKLAACPTIFWGTSLQDSNTLELISNSAVFAKNNMPKWIVVYPDEENRNLIEDFEELGFYIIEADTKDLIIHLSKQSFTRHDDDDVYIYKKYRETFPGNFICNELKRSGVRRPVVDFFSGAEPQISDIMSANVTKTSYYTEVLEQVLTNNITLITGIPGCGKSTLLMQLAFSNDISGHKFWFSNIIQQEAENLIQLVEEDRNVIVFVDNLYNSIDALQILNKVSNIKLVVAERALNFEHVKRYLPVSSNNIIDISNLNSMDIQNICKSMNRSSADAISLMKNNKNISLLEIVFFVSVNARIQDRIKLYIEDLQSFSENDLRVNLLELFALVNYTSYCGVPISMDMLYFYYSEEIDTYEDILYALDKMNKIIVESEDTNEFDITQNYLVMRSKLFAEKSLNLLPREMMAEVLVKFLDNVSIHVIYRYDIFKRRAYDADITTRAFDLEQGKNFYEKLLERNNSPYVKQQYALFLQRKKKLDLAWEQIDQAYTDCKKKIFSIANTHAIIMFEKNMEIKWKDDEELVLLKRIIENSFSTLEFCITQDIRANYHVITYARHAINYYDKFKTDDYTGNYITNALSQVNSVLQSGEYIYRGTFRELKNLQSELKMISEYV